jgi:hypothetical protein
MTRQLWTILLILVISASGIAASVDSPKMKTITGLVTYDSGEPAGGATVMAAKGNRVITGAVTSTDGRFLLKILFSDSLLLKISQIGFESEEKILIAIDDSITINIKLSQKAYEFGTVVVLPLDKMGELGKSLASEKIDFDSRHSIITSNPISAIREPQTIRDGSNYSAKLRVNGTSPIYYMNGIEMGYDPNHYGMFSIVPGSVVEKVNFFPQGSGASFGSPAGIEFATKSPFGKGIGCGLDLSFIEGTGSIWYGSDRFFVLSTARKSVLDQIADKINSSSEQRTIPPTDFLDIFLSTGLKLSETQKLFFDHYSVKDYLSYTIAATGNNPYGINTLQDTGEDFYGIRYEYYRKHLQLKLGGAIKRGNETYSALSRQGLGQAAFHVDLKSRSQLNLADMEANLFFDSYELTFGNKIKYLSGRELNLSQTNWNFLPPDASSDNPFIYQRELNTLYGNYYSHDTKTNNASYVTLRKTVGGIDIESGLRSEYFGSLAQKYKTLFRISISRNVKHAGQIFISLGTYANDPENKILEPYQILVHDNISRLLPVETRLASVVCKIGPVKVDVFEKKIAHLPSIRPDLGRIGTGNKVLPGFIAMQSEGKISSRGADITIELNNILSHFDLYTFYGYTMASKAIGNIIVPYELNSPHKYFAQVDYKLSKLMTIGGNFSIRTGYRYTEMSIADLNNTAGVNRYTVEYYNNYLKKQNAMQFPLNFSSSLYADFNMGWAKLYFSISNLTNYKNPIIRTFDGFVYDAGILPSLGFSCKF